MHGKEKSICVYCASIDEIPQLYLDSARELGRFMASEGYRLVYGGGNNGLMGILAEAVHDGGGKISGVITQQFVDMGFAYENADEMIIADDMRHRKALMEQMADAFFVMPGGYGTLEELLEIITLKQLSFHDKPIVLLNRGSFFRGLIEQFDKCYRENFIHESYRELFHVASTFEDAVLYIDGELRDSNREKK